MNFFLRTFPKLHSFLLSTLILLVSSGTNASSPSYQYQDSYDLVSTLKSENQPDTWVLLDLDNTLFEGKQAHGHADDFYHEISLLQKKGMSALQAIDHFYPEWVETQKVTEVQWIEPKAKELISSLQKKGTVVMGLTHRQAPLIPSTLRQIQSLGISFMENAASKKDLTLAFEKPAFYTQGVIFVGDSNSKGDVLVEFLKTVKKTPKRVIFFDDKKDNVNDVGRALEAMGIQSYSGIHYRAIEKRPKVFDPELAKLQKKKRNQILSNDEARLLLNSQLTPKNRS